MYEIMLFIFFSLIGIQFITACLDPDFTCWFSKKFWDIHDYHKRKGGDGTPTHFYTYTCWNCEKKFGI